MGTSPKALAAHRVELEEFRGVEVISLPFIATSATNPRGTCPHALRVTRTLIPATPSLRRSKTTDEAEPLPAQPLYHPSTE